MSKNNQKTKAKGSVAKKVIATTLVLGTLAGATAVCITNENVRTTLGIGSEPLQSEKPAENNNSTNSSSELQVQIDQLIDEKAEDLAAIKLLESEKANIQSELDSYKASLDSEKELTAEQALHIAELESAIADKENQINILNESVADKEAQISNLQSIINDLQNRVDVLEEQIGTVHNSVLERVNTYEMKYDSNNITNIFKHENLVFLSSYYSVEVLDASTGEQKCIYSSTNSSTTEFYNVNGEIYLSNVYTFGKYNPVSKGYEELISGQGTWNKLSGKLESVTTLENGKILVKTTSCIGILNTDDTWEIYRYQAYKEVDGVRYIVCGDVNTSISVSLRRIEDDGTLTELYNITTSNLNSFYTLQIHDGYAYISFNTTTNATQAKFVRVNLEIKEASILSTGSQNAFNFNMFEHNNLLFFWVANSASALKFDSATVTLTKLSYVSTSSHSTLIQVGDYVFDHTFSYVYNDSTGDFQLAKESKSTTIDSCYVVDGCIVTANRATYFDESTLTFKDFEFELSDYSGCDAKVLEANGKLFCSSSSSTSYTSKCGIFYIDIATKTIKKVADSGEGDLLNDKGYTYSKIVKLSDTHALVYASAETNKNAILINTDTMMVEDIFTKFGNDVVIYNNKVISGYENYIKIFDITTKSVNTIYSRESLNTLTKMYTADNKVFFSYSGGLGVTVAINMDDYSLEYYYGAGNVDIAGLRLGYNATQSTLFDPTTGDICNIKPYSGTAVLYDFENSIMFVFTNVAYEVLK